MLPSVTQKYILCHKQRSACVTSESHVRIPWGRNMPCKVRSSCTIWSRLYRFIFRKRKEEFASFSRLGSSETLDKDTFFKIEEFVYQVCPPNSDIKLVSYLRWFFSRTNQSQTDYRLQNIQLDKVCYGFIWFRWWYHWKPTYTLSR